MHLRPYQESGVEQCLTFLRGKNKAAYLCDEMGLGKTAQAIKIAKELGCERILVVCPASLRLNWEREFKLWGTDESKMVYPLAKGKDAARSNTSGIVVCSYDLASRKPTFDVLMARSWDIVIYDEAHYLKSGKSKRTKVCLKSLWAKATYRLMLSGTPVPNCPIDLYTIGHAIDYMLFPDYYKFGFRYTNAKRNWYTQQWEFKGGKNLDELRQICRKNFMVRRTKKAVLKELPDKIYSHIPVDVADHLCGVEIPRLSSEDAERIKLAIATGRQDLDSPQVATAKCALGKVKIPAIVEYVETMLESRKQIVLFAYHREVITALEKALEHYGVVVIHGGTAPERRQEAIDAFQAGNVRIFIGQITAAGVGITLTAASLCIFAEMHWVPADMAQAIDRLHRIGQTEVVEVHYLVAKGSMDEQIIGVLHQKILDINQVLRS